MTRRTRTETAKAHRAQPTAGGVACHEHGTGLSGFLPSSWDHLDCQSWDHPARLTDGSPVGSFDRLVNVVDVEVSGHGISGGQHD